MTALAYKGKKEKWGVRAGELIIYDPDFTKAAAERLAELEQRVNPPDWAEAKDILVAEGLFEK